MLFTTAAFACLFLPVTLILFFCIARLGNGMAAAWLFMASLLFYGVWMPAYVILLLASFLPYQAILTVRV